MRKGGAYAVDLDIIGDSCADWFAVLDAGRRLGGFWEGSVLPEPAALFVGAAASGVLDVPVCMDVKRYCAGCLAGAQDNECLYTVLGGRICNTRSTRRNRRTGGCYYVSNEK